MTTATTTHAEAMQDIFGEPISVYTRAQAIEDGFLVNLSEPTSDTAEVCRQHYKYPIACTRAVFELMRRAVENTKHANDWRGVLHDMLWMSRVFKRSIDASTVQFKVIITGAGRRRNHEFKLHVGPGDAGEPVITIMMPDED